MDRQQERKYLNDYIESLRLNEELINRVVETETRLRDLEVEYQKLEADYERIDKKYEALAGSKFGRLSRSYWTFKRKVVNYKNKKKRKK